MSAWSSENVGRGRASVRGSCRYSPKYKRRVTRGFLAARLWGPDDVAGDADRCGLARRAKYSVFTVSSVRQTLRVGGGNTKPSPTRSAGRRHYRLRFEAPRSMGIKGHDATYAGLMARSFSAVSPSIATRSASLNPAYRGCGRPRLGPWEGIIGAHYDLARADLGDQVAQTPRA